MLIPHENESIHSLLLRSLQARYGLHDKAYLKGILSAHGVVRAIPQLNPKIASYFHKFPPKYIETLILNHMPFLVYNKGLVAEIDEQIFFGIVSEDLKTVTSLRTQLRYCVSCFKEQIRQDGVPWFKLEWLSCVNCKLHNEPLSHVHQVKTKCCKSSFAINHSLNAAYAGICPKCGSTDWEFAYPIYIQEDRQDNYLFIGSRLHIHRSLPLEYRFRKDIWPE